MLCGLMFAIYFVVTIAALIALGIYMSRTLGRAVLAVAPGLTARARGRIKSLYYAVLYTLPAITIASILYSLATGGNAWVRAPQSIWFDLLLVYPFWLTVIWSAQCALFLLLLDVGRLLARVLAPAHRLRWRWWQDRLILSVAVLFAVYVPARVVWDGRTIEVRRVEHRVAGLPEALDGFRIVLVADLQADRYTSDDDLERYVRAVNEQRADLVLMAGDLITRGDEYIDVAAHHAGRMQAKHGVYTCVGDHDNWALGADMGSSVTAITEALAAQGVTMVDNDVVTFDLDGGRIAVLFVTENYIQRNNGTTLEAMLEATPQANVRIVVTHQPNPVLVDTAAQGGVDLYLAGHTHGGQVTFLFPFLDLTPVALETPYVRGHFQLGDMRVVVSNGLGVSLVPFRYNATPTVDVIELVRE
jgi:uncharacterized protein